MRNQLAEGSGDLHRNSCVSKPLPVPLFVVYSKCVKLLCRFADFRVCVHEDAVRTVPK